jgi:hypothetical protein
MLHKPIDRRAGDAQALGDLGGAEPFRAIRRHQRRTACRRGSGRDAGAWGADGVRGRLVSNRGQELFRPPLGRASRGSPDHWFQ